METTFQSRARGPLAAACALFLAAGCLHPDSEVPTTETDAGAAAVAVSPPWSTQDVGSVGKAGSADQTSSGFTVRGSGADIWGSADAFRFAYQTVAGDVEVTARVASVQNTHAWAKAGVMVREGLSAGSKHASLFVTPSSGISFQRRASTGGASASTTVSGAAPRWVRVKRAGATVSAHVSDNGTSWTQVGSVSLSLASTVTVGLAVTAHNNAVLCQASFTNVSVTQPPAAPGAAWRQANLTWFTSYPDPGSEECIKYNGCTWAGYFAALSGKQPESWVKANNIIAVHEKDFAKYKLKNFRVRQKKSDGTYRQIDAKVYDMCSDKDCNGCCTKNASSTGFLIDMEKYTKERFGSGSGIVDWQCLDC